ncbi:MAG: sigma-70 family RNA polymerase sigma factor [Chloroflexi bacterium]|nr:sigma-70 family RNA polymerase sigma factor [Chloroflexota bacterium]
MATRVFPTVEGGWAAESDEALVERARFDAEAFGELYERYISRIYSYLYYRTGSQADAEDLAEKVFLQALANLPRYTQRGRPFAAWLYTIAHNLLANWHRDRRRRNAMPIDDTRDLGIEAPSQENWEEASTLRQAVGELPQNRQLLVHLKYVEEMSNAEIGAIMGLSEGAVKSLLHRTLRSLRQRIAISPDER